VGDPSGLLSSLQIYVYSAVYAKTGQLTQRTLGAFGSRVAVTSTFDEPTRRLTSTNVVPELLPEAADWAYEYTDAGDVKRIQEQPGGQTADTQCYSYDYLRRLTGAWTPSSGDCNTAPTLAGLGGPAPYWHGWTFDVTGNRLSEVRHAATHTTYTYTHPTPGSPRPHTVTNVTATGGVSFSRNYTYDNAGNTKTRPNSTGVTQTLTYDREGELASLVDGGTTTSYIYDADGNRLVRSDGTGKTLYLPDGTEVRYTNATAVKTASRYYTHAGTLIALRTAAGLHWIVGDHHGTAEVAINATTLAAAKRRSLPYGDTRGGGSGTWPSAMDKGFVGGTKDPTGLTHLGAREYDPTLGRFLSVDPLQDLTDPQHWHGYSYANNNPTSMSDPSGLAPFLDENPLGKGAPAPAPQPTTKPKTFEEIVRASGGTGCTLPPDLPTNIGMPADPIGVEILITPVPIQGPEILITTLPLEWLEKLLRFTIMAIGPELDTTLKTPPGIQGPVINCSTAAGSGNSLPIPGAMRLSQQEQLTAGRLIRSPDYTGGKLSEWAKDRDYDYVDQYGRTYDAIGGEAAFQNRWFNMERFLRALDGHDKDGLNFTVLDTTGATDEQVDVVLDHVLQYSPSRQKEILWVWE
jgi:RHS repeat-associated protein